MNIDNITPSTLHVVAKEIDVSEDLNDTTDKSIAELLNEEKNEEEPENGWWKRVS